MRPATPADAPALARIMDDWIIETGWMPRLHSLSQTVGFLAQLISTCDVVVTGDAEPVGFLARDGADIRALYLAPQARGLGWGAALIDHAKGASDRLTLWVFQANPRAVAFYLREGLTEATRTDGQGNDEKLPDIRMVWERPA
jgi:GNAT superfamily N-acetyltransferase